VRVSIRVRIAAFSSGMCSSGFTALAQQRLTWPQWPAIAPYRITTGRSVDPVCCSRFTSLGVLTWPWRRKGRICTMRPSIAGVVVAIDVNHADHVEMTLTPAPLVAVLHSATKSSSCSYRAIGAV